MKYGFEGTPETLAVARPQHIGVRSELTMQSRLCMFNLHTTVSSLEIIVPDIRVTGLQRRLEEVRHCVTLQIDAFTCIGWHIE